MASPYHPGRSLILAWPRTVLFYIYIALATLVVGTIGLPLGLRGREAANKVATFWLDQLLGAARIILGLRVEYRGTPPAGDALIASKHQSFMDILALARACPRRVFVMKRQLMNIPIMGWFARRVGCIPIDRSKGKEAMRQIIAEVSAAQQSPEGLGQLVFYPEGTRTAPGQKAPYKHGVTVVQRASGLPIVPVAVNCGMFWPKRGFPIRSGITVVEFLPIVPAGMRAEELLTHLEIQIEAASDALFHEAGGAAALTH